MKILFLTTGENMELPNWLSKGGNEVLVFRERISLGFVRDISPDYIISYGYHYILKKDIINFIGDNIII